MKLVILCDLSHPIRYAYFLYYMSLPPTAYPDLALML